MDIKNLQQQQVTVRQQIYSTIEYKKLKSAVQWCYRI